MRWILITLFLLLIINTVFSQNHPNNIVINRITGNNVNYPLKVVIIGDNYNVNDIYLSLISHISTLNPPIDFAIQVGDFASGGSETGYNDYLSVIDSLPYNYISVIGNHEIDYDGGLERYINNFGSTDFYFDWGDYRFIGIRDCYSSDTPDIFGDYCDYMITDSQLLWLENILQDDYPRFKMIFLHAPPMVVGHLGAGCLGGYGGQPSRTESNTERFTELCKEYNVLLVGMGHAHVYDRYQANNEQYGSVIYLICGGGGGRLTPWPYVAPYGGSFYHYALLNLFEDGTIVGKVFRSDSVSVFQDTLYNFEYSSTNVKDDDNKELDGISIYPNPFNSSLTISYDGNLNDATIKIYDITGRLKKESVLSTNQNNQLLYLSDLKSGMYFLKIEIANKKIYQKIICIK